MHNVYSYVWSMYNVYSYMWSMYTYHTYLTHLYIHIFNAIQSYMPYIQIRHAHYKRMSWYNGRKHLCTHSVHKYCTCMLGLPTMYDFNSYCTVMYILYTGTLLFTTHICIWYTYTIIAFITYMTPFIAKLTCQGWL